MSEELIELGRACRKGQIVRRGFRTRRGRQISPACVKDVGRPGKTPASKKVLPIPEPGFLKGWKKAMPASKRHAIVKAVNKAEGCASTIRRLNLLANYTKRTSPETHKKAREDMAWVRKQSFCKLKSKE